MKWFLMVLVLVFSLSSAQTVKAKSAVISKKGKVSFLNFPKLGSDRSDVIHILGNPDQSYEGKIWTYGAAFAMGGGGDEDLYVTNQVQINFSADSGSVPVVTQVRVSCFYIVNNPVKSDKLDLLELGAVLPAWAMDNYLYLSGNNEERNIQKTIFLTGSNGIVKYECQAWRLDYSSGTPAIVPIENPRQWRVYSEWLSSYTEEVNDLLLQSTPLKVATSN